MIPLSSSPREVWMDEVGAPSLQGRGVQQKQANCPQVERLNTVTSPMVFSWVRCKALGASGGRAVGASGTTRGTLEGCRCGMTQGGVWGADVRKQRTSVPRESCGLGWLC